MAECCGSIELAQSGEATGYRIASNARMEYIRRILKLTIPFKSLKLQSETSAKHH